MPERRLKYFGALSGSRQKPGTHSQSLFDAQNCRANHSSVIYARRLVSCRASPSLRDAAMSFWLQRFAGRGSGRWQPERPPYNPASSGLRTARPGRFKTCVYTMVVLTSLCPNSSWTVLMSEPLSSKCVAKECRKVWQLAGFSLAGAPRSR